MDEQREPGREGSAGHDGSPEAAAPRPASSWGPLARRRERIAGEEAS